MISALSWIPKGVAKSVPEVAEPPSKEEIEEMINGDAGGDSGSEAEEEDEKDMDLDAAKESGEVEQALAVANALGRSSKKHKSAGNFDDLTDALKELDMDNYDEEEEGVNLFSSVDHYYPSNDMDPYLKDEDDDDSEELEDMVIQPKDGVIVCAGSEDDFHHLEVYIVEESDGSDPHTYVHHDIVLSEFPLCTAWLDCPIKGGERGNFIAVGSMGLPSIEIWDLDIIEEVEPSVVLGGIVEKKKEKGKKVQAVAWNHQEPQVLLSGSFDHSVVMKDGRVPSHPGFKWSVTADVECLAWDPHTNYSFVVSLEDGTIQGFDIRAAKSDSPSSSRPSFTLNAHDKEVSALAYNPSVPNLLATGSGDKMVKLWDLSNNQPSCVASRNLKVGAVFSLSFSEDSPSLLAIGGSRGDLKVWDTSSDAGVARRFGK
ncbi:hypothetical protein Tsubulata_000347 [Turnera subulata]|uniref:Anaphase-promoting complex subunit 4 WD40 domain-containing protein n=1 Tax=Turnera subulata TaxID=218843 RepID=A0A9Q0F0Y5_9ROSI|nr:hypothetical protein Tsubulata_000347 [Turnera subulata]